MSHVTIGSIALFGALIGGIALVQIRPTIGPFNFNRESPLLSEDDEQRARALRIAAERKAEKAAEKRAKAEEDAEEAARQRKSRDDTAVKTESGEVYAILCKTSEPPYRAVLDPAFLACLSKTEGGCPLKRSESLGPNDWSARYRDDGWLFFC